MLGFEIVKGMYSTDEDFKEVYAKCTNHPHGLFHVLEGFLFKGVMTLYTQVWGLGSY